jgi:lactate permease
MLQSLLALTPIILTLVLILVLKRSTLESCMGGILAALVLAKLPVGFQLSTERGLLALESAAYLALSVALVVLPGLFLTEVLKGQGVIDGISSKISAIPLDPAAKLLILLLGVLPAVESLTGFGVSLFLSVPVLLKLFEPAMARRLALLGMNIMPWGTLALATIVGASLVGERVAALGMVSAVTSAPVFPLLGLVALYTLGGWPMVRRWSLLALLLGLGLPVLLYLAARYASVETAGVAAGLGVAALAMVGLRLMGQATSSEEQGPSLVRLFMPYLLVFALIVVTRLVPPLWDWLKSAGLLRNARVTFAPLASPGVCLLAVALLLQALRPIKCSVPPSPFSPPAPSWCWLSSCARRG